MRFTHDQEHTIHTFFEISIIAKGFIALVQTIAGVAVFFISQSFWLRVIKALTEDELAPDSHDFIREILVSGAHALSVGPRFFIGFYLASHGLIKGLLILALLKKKLWAYPLAMAVFGLFIVYQMYQYVFHSHSVWLILLSVLDVLVILLTWHEYTYMKRYHTTKLP
jgi:uncharacterized membrane protein